MLIHTVSRCRPLAGLIPSAILLMAMFALAGCQSAQVGESLTGRLAGNEPESQLEFWHTLASRPLVSHDEAFHALLLFAQQQDPAANYPQRVQRLQQRGWLADNFDAPADQAITRGTLSVALVRILQIRGGWMMTLLGPTPRYATRELEFQGIYPASTPQQTFSGGQFVAIIGAAEDYLRGNQVNLTAKLLPDEAAPLPETTGAQLHAPDIPQAVQTPSTPVPAATAPAP